MLQTSDMPLGGRHASRNVAETLRCGFFMAKLSISEAVHCVCLEGMLTAEAEQQRLSGVFF